MSLAEIVVGGASAAVTAIAAYVAYLTKNIQKTQADFQGKAYDSQEKERQLNALMQIHQMLGDENGRKYRKTIYDAYRPTKSLDWQASDAVIVAVGNVRGDLDIIGSMIHRGLVPPDGFLDMYSGVVTNMWKILLPSIEAERKNRVGKIMKNGEEKIVEDPYMSYFAQLFEAAKTYRADRGLPLYTIY